MFKLIINKIINMKPKTIIISFLALLILFISLNFYTKYQEAQKQSPQTAINEYFTKIKSGEYNWVNIITNANDKDKENQSPEAVQQLKDTMNKLTWKISPDTEKVTGRHYVTNEPLKVEVEVTVNGPNINYTLQKFDTYLHTQDEYTSSKELAQKSLEFIKDAKYSSRTCTVTLTREFTNNKPGPWQVSSDHNLRILLMGRE